MFARREIARKDDVVDTASVWKPLRGPVRDSPLSVCDYRTVKDSDRVPTDIVFPDYLGETYNFRPNPSHRFYFIDEQREDEAWMIKCFDSQTATNPEIAQCTDTSSLQSVLLLLTTPSCSSRLVSIRQQHCR